MVSEDGEGQATALIHKAHLEGWGISRKELRDIAFKNTIAKSKNFKWGTFFSNSLFIS